MIRQNRQSRHLFCGINAVFQLMNVYVDFQFITYFLKLHTIKFYPEKEIQKGKMKNTKVQKYKNTKDVEM